MKKQIITLLALSLLLIVPSTSEAVIMSANDTTFGADSITRDTASNLDWLDLTITANQSWNQVNSQLATTYAGFRFATDAELNILRTNAGFVGSALADRDAAIALINLIGILTPSASTNFSDGFTSNLANATDHNFSRLLYTDTVGQFIIPASFLGPDIVSPQFGSYLVRDSSSVVPEPITLTLFGTGLVGAFIRRRKES